jgi:arsenite-transporting ATPase
MNRSLSASGTRDPLLSARLAAERRQFERVTGGLASRLFVVPWFARPPVGAAALRAVVQSPTTDLGA